MVPFAPDGFLADSLIFLAVWAAVVLLHWSLLHLPYYWDEAGYYIPAARDFFLSGSLVPYSTLTNAHPPLPSVVLAAVWKLFGYAPVVTRVVVAGFAAAAITAVYRLARVFTAAAPAAAVAALTALYPVWFAQSTLAHADIFAAAFTLWALALYAESGQVRGLSVLCLCLAVLCKESALVTPLALLCASFWRFVRGRHLSELWEAVAWTAPVFPLAAWYVYHYLHTGFVFGNPEYLRYNATGNLHISRILFAMASRLWHVAGHMNLFVPLLLTLVLWLLPARKPDPENTAIQSGGVEKHDGPGENMQDESLTQREGRKDVISALMAVFIANLLFYSVAGGALLTRYLLSLFPLVLLFHVCFWRSRTRQWWAPVLVTAAAFVIGWTVNPPYGFTAEDNLSYRDVVVLTVRAIAQLPSQASGVRVLTAWPVTDALTKPELGYVSEPYAVVPLKDLTIASLLDAHNGGVFQRAILFPSGPEPTRRLFALGGEAQRTNEAFFGAHENASPQVGARLLGMQVSWQQQMGGEWAAVLSSPQPVVDVNLAVPDQPRFYTRQ